MGKDYERLLKLYVRKDQQLQQAMLTAERAISKGQRQHEQIRACSARVKAQRMEIRKLQKKVAEIIHGSVDEMYKRNMEMSRLLDENKVFREHIDSLQKSKGMSDPLFEARMECKRLTRELDKCQRLLKRKNARDTNRSSVKRRSKEN